MDIRLPAKLLSGCLIILAASRSGKCDGLVFSLPEDRTGAVFELEFNIDQAGKKMTQKGRVTITSVGRAEVAEVKLRWLEIDLEMTEGEGKYRMIYKPLIPEKFLQEGGSPSESILKCWWTRKIGVKEAGRPIKAELLEKHPHDERWSYLPTMILSGALNEKKPLAPAQLDTIFGKQACGGVAGKFDYEQETRKWETVVEARLHAKAPFGVVESRIAFRMSRMGNVFTGDARFKLKEVLQNQDGVLKDHK